MKMQCKKARKTISLALDSRLTAAVSAELNGHLDDCPACRDWQKGQAWIQQRIKAAPIPVQLSANLFSVLQNKINEPRKQKEFFTFSPSAFRPALLRAAMLLILAFSALLGFFLSGRLDARAADPATTVFSRTMNLDAFADLPAESFGAVYDRLLQGGLQ